MGRDVGIPVARGRPVGRRRRLGAAHRGETRRARIASARLEVLEAATRQAGEELFARNIQVLRLRLEAWLAHGEGLRDSSVALMAAAAALEGSTPKHAVTPGPTLPAEELLGDLFLVQARHAEALEAFRRALDRYRGRFNSLFGAAQAARALHDAPQARRYYQARLAVAQDGIRRQPALAEAKEYLARRQ